MLARDRRGKFASFRIGESSSAMTFTLRLTCSAEEKACRDKNEEDLLRSVLEKMNSGWLDEVENMNDFQAKYFFSYDIDLRCCIMFLNVRKRNCVCNESSYRVFIVRLPVCFKIVD